MIGYGLNPEILVVGWILSLLVWSGSYAYLWQRRSKTLSQTSSQGLADLEASEEARRKIEERFALAARGTQDGMWDWDIVTDEVWYSDRFRELLGYSSPEEFPPAFKSFATSLHPDDYDPAMEAIRRHTEDGERYEVEYRLRVKTGRYRWFLARGETLRDKDGNSIRMAGSIQDITERRNLLDRLRKKSEEVEAFVYVVSHDLRAPLVNLQGFTKEIEYDLQEVRRLAQRSTLSPGDLERLVTLVDSEIPASFKFVKASTTKFERLIDALVRLSRTGRQEYALTELSTEELVDETLQTLQALILEKKARIEREQLPLVLGDEIALAQVFANLLTNALKYSHPGRPPRIKIGASKEGEDIRFWVQDNGLGLSKEQTKKAFEVFRRVHPKAADGEGIGLPLVKRIVERHGGKIWAEGEVGEGTTFFFTLPRIPMPKESDQ